MSGPTVQDLRAARRGALAIDLFAVSISLAANVASAPATPMGYAVAAVAPLFLFVAVLLWHRSHSILTGWLGRAFNGCLAAIAVAAAWVSYGHMAHVAAGPGGQSSTVAAVLPLVVDGIAVLSTIVYVAAGQALTALEATEQRKTQRKAPKTRTRPVSAPKPIEAEVVEPGPSKPTAASKGGTAAAIAGYLAAHPEATKPEVAEAVGCSTKSVQRSPAWQQRQSVEAVAA